MPCPGTLRQQFRGDQPHRYHTSTEEWNIHLHRLRFPCLVFTFRRSPIDLVLSILDACHICALRFSVLTVQQLPCAD